MSRCRCHDIREVRADQGRLGGIESAIAAFERRLDETDAAARSLKQTVSSAVDITLGGVPDDRFSADGRQASSAARASLDGVRDRLARTLSQYQREDDAYHEQVRREQERRRREAERRREEERRRRERESRERAGR